jgi:uncharacterized phage protein (TIGR02216 family)
MKPRERFPWRRAMQLGLGYLRLSPRDFWQMTPKELAAALTAAEALLPAPLDRNDLNKLMQLFPDQHEPR